MSGLAVFGGIQAASAGGGPVLTCPNTTASAGTINFDGGSNGIYFNANAGQTAALTANALGGATGISINESAVSGQTLSIAGVAGTFTVTNDVMPNAPSHLPTNLTITPALPTTTAKGNVLAKAKTAVTVNATDGTNNTEAYNDSQTEDVSLTFNGCTSSSTVAGDFSPTIVYMNGTATVSNAALGLEGTPASLSSSITFPPIGAGWVQPQTDTLTFTSSPKADSINLGSFAITYGGGVEAGDYADGKASVHLNALDAMTVCTQGELEAIQNTSVEGYTNPGGPDSTNNGGLIASGADPLSVCDGGTLNYNAGTQVGGAYPFNGLFGDVVAAETNNTGATIDGGDGTPPVAIWAIQVDNSLQPSSVF